MTRIEVRNMADNRVIGEHTTDAVISVSASSTLAEVAFGPGKDGRIFCVIPALQFVIRDITINKPRDLMMVTVEPIAR